MTKEEYLIHLTGTVNPLFMSTREKMIAERSFFLIQEREFELSALRKEYNALGVKFDKEIERWQERDVSVRADRDEYRAALTNEIKTNENLTLHCEDLKAEIAKYRVLYAGADTRRVQETIILEDEIQVLRKRCEDLEAAAKETRFVLEWHLKNSKPRIEADQSDFFNYTTNAISKSDKTLSDEREG